MQTYRCTGRTSGAQVTPCADAQSLTRMEALLHFEKHDHDCDPVPDADPVYGPCEVCGLDHVTEDHEEGTIGPRNAQDGTRYAEHIKNGAGWLDPSKGYGGAR